MVVYVAIVAIVNLGLGYLLGVYMERSQRNACAADLPHDEIHA